MVLGGYQVNRGTVNTPSNVTRIGPQPGPQTDFASCTADVAIFGGGAYGGKTYSILLEPLRATSNPRFNGVIFRREMPQITAGGGLWDTSEQIYPKCGGRSVPSRHMWKWGTNGASIKMTHLQRESDRLSHHSAQYVFIAFDELQMFTEQQFWYLWTRNRPPSGYNGRCWMRAGCNPEADSWIRELIDWWIGPDGYVIPERSGVLRYFTRKDDKIHWVSQDWRDPSGLPPKSFTFIQSLIDNNEIGNQVDPTYKSNLYAQDLVTRERLLKGNWNINYSGGMINPDWIQFVDEVPEGIKCVRYWDLASTPKDDEETKNPDWTAGGLVGTKDGNIYICDMVRFQKSAGDAAKTIRATAEIDGYGVIVGYEEEHGASGKYTSEYMKGILKGFDFRADYVTGDKVERAKPWAAEAEHGRVYMVRGEWNRRLLAEMGSFPLHKKDQVDSVSGAVKLLKTSQRVWKWFNRVNEKHHGKLDLKWQNYWHYGAIVIGKDTRLWVLAGCYVKHENKLYIYGELQGTQTGLKAVARRIVTGMDYQKRLVHGLYGNHDMFSSSMKSTAITINTEIQKLTYGKHCKGIGLVSELDYDKLGSIGFVNQMFMENRIVIDESCIETARQCSSWYIEDKKPYPHGFEFCECLCILGSVINKWVAPKHTIKRGDPHYKPVKKKKTIRERGNSWQMT